MLFRESEVLEEGRKTQLIQEFSKKPLSLGWSLNLSDVKDDDDTPLSDMEKDSSALVPVHRNAIHPRNQKYLSKLDSEMHSRPGSSAGDIIMPSSSGASSRTAPTLRYQSIIPSQPPSGPEKSGDKHVCPHCACVHNGFMISIAT
mmetsp:Transcript_1326/g.3634  ORF Transcript_1326/g.3634 Transcript_1326/m.3634 type:complete len:145 (+) Transcript_1326:367-801(+)